VSAARVRLAEDRLGVTLALVPPPSQRARPRPPRLQGVWWLLRDGITYRLRYRFLGGVVRRLATRRFRERAWLAGFAFSFDDRREPFWAGLLDEFGDGNQAGLTASMPIWSARQQLRPRRPGRLARLARLLPASRAEAARINKRADGAFEAVLMFATAVCGVPSDAQPRARQPRPRHLVAIDSSAWQED
jgi:hypothetical protein